MQANGSPKYTTTAGALPVSDDFKDHNSYFGMHLSIDFALPEGYMGDLNYVFFGDDDAWLLLAGLSGMDGDSTRVFADKLFEGIKGLGADLHTTSKSFTGVDQGYYLIAEAELDGENDTRSLVMLDTAGHQNITVKSKEDIPKVTKKIIEGTNEVDATDAAIGDVVNYELTGTLPANVSGYKTYFYQFHDKITGGLKVDMASVRVTVDGVDKTEHFTITNEGDCDLDVSIADLFSVGEVSATTVVKVNYSATVVEEGLLTTNTGNPNTVHLEFSNDPYGDGKGETPKDKVTVFSFKVVVDKTDKDGKPLAGAKFTLQMQQPDGSFKDLYVDVGDGEATEFVFNGLDSGIYKLIESQVPDGYNKADDIIFEVKSTYDKESDNPELTGLVVLQDGKDVSTGEGAKFSVTLVEGTIDTAIVNTTGVQMPGTGGAGVYLIYAGGAVLLAGGAALAVSKKKQSASK